MKQIILSVDRIYVNSISKLNPIQLLKIAFSIVFVWFGVLKLIGLSPAEGLAYSLVHKVTDHPNWAHPLFILLAWMEVSIGVLFLFSRTMKYAVILLFLQMPLTFLPLIFLSDATFLKAPLIPNMEGQYIIKNLVYIAAGVLLGQASEKQKLNESPGKHSI